MTLGAVVKVIPLGNGTHTVVYAGYEYAEPNPRRLTYVKVNVLISGVEAQIGGIVL